jgi:hypothetical protein
MNAAFNKFVTLAWFAIIFVVALTVIGPSFPVEPWYSTAVMILLFVHCIDAMLFYKKVFPDKLFGLYWYNIMLPYVLRENVQVVTPRLKRWQQRLWIELALLLLLLIYELMKSGTPRTGLS